MACSWLFPLALLLLMRCLVISLAIPWSNFTDESALLAFKAQIIDPSNTITKNWSTATSFCYWLGVTCSASHQRVTALDISYMDLTGIIPPHIGNLSFLASINLSNNSFHGNLPNELWHLHRLRIMNLDNNSLAGFIPPSIFNIRKLEVLSLGGNFLQGNISDNVGNLSSLQRLYLRNNQLSGVIPPIIFNLSSLQFISLSHNYLSGDLPVHLCNEQSKLEWLDVGNNQLHGQIPPGLYKCKELQALGLNSNNFTGSIPREIGKVVKLKRLFLGYNNLRGSIPIEIGNCTLLEQISFPVNNLTGRIPNDIGNLQNLQNLNLAFNMITGPIPSAVFNLSKAKQIGLTSNLLSGHLPSSIGLTVPNLEHLYLGINQLSGPIPDFICNASQLVELDFNSNSFSGFIPDCLGNLRNLQLLSFVSNFLKTKYTSSGWSFLSSLRNCQNLLVLLLDKNPIGGRLPASMGNLSTTLRTFTAPDCKIKGSIPKEIGTWSNLIELMLENNTLSGRIPRTIVGLQNLQSLALGGNNLAGSIPDEICQLQSLAYMYLSNNKLSGGIPACLGNLTSLRTLSLAFNRFTGSIPISLWRLNDILELYLTSNSLRGSIPFEIGGLKVVTTIDISMNQLSGSIPSSIGGLNDLVFLNLSDNRLAGPIPNSFGGLVSVELLDLSRNELSGEIPKSLEKLLHLKHLNLSFNQLQGTIPDGGVFANFSAESFLGNEALCGSPQMQVPPCKRSTHQSSRTFHTLALTCILPVVTFIILVLAFVVILTRYRKRKTMLPIQGDLVPLTTWRRISQRELEVATDSFQVENLIGSGSFGSVYKGTLSDGMIVAIKVFKLHQEKAVTSFDIECEVLCSLRHRNLVKVISSCCNTDFKALILEYMSSGSLEKWLHSHNSSLDILERLNIMIDVASALEYLHNGNTVPVVHCDLKPSNVLLDQNMVAHLSDFGMAKLLGEGDSMTQTMTLATIGYMAPEYGSEGIVSVRGDVYSYGILLMETFTRKKPTDEMFAGEMSLKLWIKQSLPHSVAQVVDSNLLNEGRERLAFEENCIKSILEVALDCSADLPEERMHMKDVLAALKNIKTKLSTDLGRRP